MFDKVLNEIARLEKAIEEKYRRVKELSKEIENTWRQYPVLLECRELAKPWEELLENRVKDIDPIAWRLPNESETLLCELVYKTPIRKTYAVVKKLKDGTIVGFLVFLKSSKDWCTVTPYLLFVILPNKKVIVHPVNVGWLAGTEEYSGLIHPTVMKVRSLLRQVIPEKQLKFILAMAHKSRELLGKVSQLESEIDRIMNEISRLKTELEKKQSNLTMAQLCMKEISELEKVLEKVDNIVEDLSQGKTVVVGRVTISTQLQPNTKKLQVKVVHNGVVIGKTEFPVEVINEWSPLLRTYVTKANITEKLKEQIKTWLRNVLHENIEELKNEAKRRITITE